MPSYYNPNNKDDIWNGKGRKPVWVTELIESGSNLEDYQVLSGRGRKPIDNQVEDFSVTDADTPALPEMVEAANQQAHQLIAIDKEYSDNLPYDRTRIENEAKFYLAQSAQAMIEAGKRLILLKEHEPHGEFTESLKRIGIEPRTARNMMKATIKFTGKTETVSVLSVSKLYTLMLEDDEDLQALEDGGTVAGLKLDAIDKMTNAELKRALREEKRKREEEAEASERLLDQKDKKINELDKKLIKAEQRSLLWDERAREIQLEITTVGVDALQAIARLDELRDVILNEQYDEEPSELEMQAKACVYYDMVQQLVAGVGNLMHACDQVFGGYKEGATPMVDYWGDLNDVKEI